MNRLNNQEKSLIILSKFYPLLFFYYFNKELPEFLKISSIKELEDANLQSQISEWFKSLPTNEHLYNTVKICNFYHLNFIKPDSLGLEQKILDETTLSSNELYNQITSFSEDNLDDWYSNLKTMSPLLIYFVLKKLYDNKKLNEKITNDQKLVSLLEEIYEMIDLTKKKHDL